MIRANAQFDLVVIGAGPAGYVCAVRGAQLGLKVACVEATDTLGGTCLNVGCVPSKALLESSHLYHMSRRQLKNHGICVDSVKLDLQKMQKRKEEVVEGTVTGVDYLFKKNKITRLQGAGSLAGQGQVRVSDRAGKESLIGGAHIVIATGSRPVQIPPAPFDHRHIIDSTDALALQRVPEHLVVVGGGVIGLELGSVWLRLGARVTVIEALDNILGSMDAAISREMLKLLKKQGMEFHLSTSLIQAKVHGEQVHLSCQNAKGADLEFKADKVLIAAGRKPATTGLNLEKAGVATDGQGFIKVDQFYQSSARGIYAIGDVIPGLMLAHKAEEEGIAVAGIIAGRAGSVNYQAIASIVYTWPEIAAIGKTEEECKRSGIPYKSGKFFFKANARAKAMGSTEGFVKILAHKETDLLLGIHIIGPMASEMAAEASLAFEYGASAEDIARSVHAHPTLAEVMKEAALDVDGAAIHS